MKVPIVCRRSRTTMHGSAVAPFSSPRLIRLIWHIIRGCCCCLDATWLPATSALMGTISRGKSINNSWRPRQARSHNKFHLIKLIKMLCNYVSWRELRDKVCCAVYIFSAVIFEGADKTINTIFMRLIFIILNAHGSEINISVKEVLSVWHSNVIKILNYWPLSVVFFCFISFLFLLLFLLLLLSLSSLFSSPSLPPHLFFSSSPLLPHSSGHSQFLPSFLLTMHFPQSTKYSL